MITVSTLVLAIVIGGAVLSSFLGGVMYGKAKAQKEILEGPLVEWMRVSVRADVQRLRKMAKERNRKGR